MEDYLRTHPNLQESNPCFGKLRIAIARAAAPSPRYNLFTYNCRDYVNDYAERAKTLMTPPPPVSNVNVNSPTLFP